MKHNNMQIRWKSSLANEELRGRVMQILCNFIVMLSALYFLSGKTFNATNATLSHSSSYELRALLYITLDPGISLITLLNFVGVFIARGKEDALVTKNMVPGEVVYGEKRISIEVRNAALGGMML